MMLLYPPSDLPTSCCLTPCYLMVPTSTHHANRSQWGTSTCLNEEKFVLVDVKEFDLLLLLNDEEEFPSIREGDELLSADKEDKVLCTK